MFQFSESQRTNNNSGNVGVVVKNVNVEEGLDANHTRGGSHGKVEMCVFDKGEDQQEKARNQFFKSPANFKFELKARLFPPC